MMVKKIFNYLNLAFYYLLLLTGLSMVSWTIWSRFIRERTIRDIPDMFMSEYRFWILIYICYIYIIVIKDLILPSKEGAIFYAVAYEISQIIYKPLITLDHLIKYNKYIKPYYYSFMFKFAVTMDKYHFDKVKWIVFFIQIFPRIVLVTFLVIDIFYFHKLELFYKVILIGLLPFTLRYFKYSLKDIYEHWIKELEAKYAEVRIKIIVDEYAAIEAETMGITVPKVYYPIALYHHQYKPIREYIEIKFSNIFEYLHDDVEYEYDSFPYTKEEIVEEYCLAKYNRKKYLFTAKDLMVMQALYNELMPNVIYMKRYLFRFETIAETKLILWSRIIMYSLYLLCWSYILIISYYYYPIELSMGKYLLMNFIIYLCEQGNPFAELYWGSLNENLITKESINYFYEIIINKILKWLDQ